MRALIYGWKCAHTCMRTHAHQSIHPFIRAYLRARAHPCIYAAMQACAYAPYDVLAHAGSDEYVRGRSQTRAYAHPCIRAYAHTCIHAYMRALVRDGAHGAPSRLDACAHASVCTRSSALLRCCGHALLRPCLYIHPCAHARECVVDCTGDCTGECVPFPASCMHGHAHDYLQAYVT